MVKLGIFTLLSRSVTPKKCTKRSDASAVVVLLNYLLFVYFVFYSELLFCS